MPLIQEFTGTGAWVPLSATSIPFKGTLTADISNTGNILIRATGSGVSSKLIPGEYVTCDPINLREIEIQGVGQVLKIFGTSTVGQA